jgi:hypothetical protein
LDDIPEADLAQAARSWISTATNPSAPRNT